MEIRFSFEAHQTIRNSPSVQLGRLRMGLYGHVCPVRLVGEDTIAYTVIIIPGVEPGDIQR